MVLSVNIPGGSKIVSGDNQDTIRRVAGGNHPGLCMGMCMAFKQEFEYIQRVQELENEQRRLENEQRKQDLKNKTLKIEPRPEVGILMGIATVILEGREHLGTVLEWQRQCRQWQEHGSSEEEEMQIWVFELPKFTLQLKGRTLEVTQRNLGAHNVLIYTPGPTSQAKYLFDPNLGLYEFPIATSSKVICKNIVYGMLLFDLIAELSRLPAVVALIQPNVQGSARAELSVMAARHMMRTWESETQYTDINTAFPMPYKDLQTSREFISGLKLGPDGKLKRVKGVSTPAEEEPPVKYKFKVIGLCDPATSLIGARTVDANEDRIQRLEEEMRSISKWHRVRFAPDYQLPEDRVLELPLKRCRQQPMYDTMRRNPRVRSGSARITRRSQWRRPHP